MTAVIYARYSSDNQREESIEGQIRECTAYAEKNGITIVKHYIDRAISAKTDNRPEFQQMIKDSDKKLFDIVLVWKLDRFARNRYDSARYKTQLKKNGVKLINAIYLYDDKVLITFNYKKGTQTVTFGEASEVASEGNSSDLDCIPAPQKRQLLIAVFLFYPAIPFNSTGRTEDLNKAVTKRGILAALPGPAARQHRPVQIFLCTGQSPPVRGILKAE